METVEAICVFAGTVALGFYAYMEYRDCHPAVPPPIPGPSQQENDNGNACRRVPQFPIEEYYNREWHQTRGRAPGSASSTETHSCQTDLAAEQGTPSQTVAGTWHS